MTGEPFPDLFPAMPLRDLPRCRVCRFRHEGDCDEVHPSPWVRYAGTTLNGRTLWIVRGNWVETPGKEGAR